MRDMCSSVQLCTTPKDVGYAYIVPEDGTVWIPLPCHILLAMALNDCKHRRCSELNSVQWYQLQSTAVGQSAMAASNAPFNKGSDNFKTSFP